MLHFKRSQTYIILCYLFIRNSQEEADKVAGKVAGKVAACVGVSLPPVLEGGGRSPPQTSLRSAVCALRSTREAATEEEPLLRK